MHIHITHAQTSDWKIYKTIRLEALKREPQAFCAQYEHWLYTTDEQWQERLNNSRTSIFIASDRKIPIGMLGVYRENDVKKTNAEIWGVYVNSNYRGQGIGKNLMEHAFASIQKMNGVKHVHLMVNDEQAATIGFYKTIGFHIQGTEQMVLGDGKIHQLHIMGKNITTERIP